LTKLIIVLPKEKPCAKDQRRVSETDVTGGSLAVFLRGASCLKSPLQKFSNLKSLALHFAARPDFFQLAWCIFFVEAFCL
jgi:hypothetical protein